MCLLFGNNSTWLYVSERIQHIKGTDNMVSEFPMESNEGGLLFQMESNEGGLLSRYFFHSPPQHLCRHIYDCTSVPSHIWLEYRCMWRKTPINSNSTKIQTVLTTTSLEFELLRMTFVIEDGIPTCIVEVKEEIDGRTPEKTAEQLRRMLNNQFPEPHAPMPPQNGPATTPQGPPLRRSTRRRKPRVCPYCH